MQFPAALVSLGLLPWTPIQWKSVISLLETTPSMGFITSVCLWFPVIDAAIVCYWKVSCCIEQEAESAVQGYA